MKGEQGFTLVELLVTVTILVILASIVMPLTQMSVKRSKEMELRQSLRIIRAAIDDYKKACDNEWMKKSVDMSCYPPSLEVLVDGVEDTRSAQGGKKIRFLRKVPGDPMNDDKTLKPEETWGLRSYQSDPDDPREGEDVFDAFSKSEETAIDGTPYKSW